MLNPICNQCNKTITNPKNRVFCNQTCKTIYVTGRKLCQKTCENMSKARMGYRHPDNINRKISISMKKLFKSGQRKPSKAIPTLYNGITYRAGWEATFAKRLDELGIAFQYESKVLQWTDSKGITHNYRPDFYLPSYDRFVEIKSKYTLEIDKVQTEKFYYIHENFKNIHFIWSLKDIKSFEPSHLNEMK